MVGEMSSVKKGIAAAVALVMVATVLAGCTDDDNGITWENPTLMLLGEFSASDTNEWVVINITMGDKAGLVTQADGTLRVAIFDDNDVEMLNKTWEVKKDDFAEWNDAESHVDWTIKTKAFTEAVTCNGRNEILADGDATVVRLTGELNIALKGIPGVPSFLAKRLAPQVEKFIVSLITPNLEKVNQSIERFLDAENRE